MTILISSQLGSYLDILTADGRFIRAHRHGGYKLEEETKALKKLQTSILQDQDRIC